MRYVFFLLMLLTFPVHAASPVNLSFDLQGEKGILSIKAPVKKLFIRARAHGLMVWSPGISLKPPVMLPSVIEDIKIDGGGVFFIFSKKVDYPKITRQGVMIMLNFSKPFDVVDISPPTKDPMVVSLLQAQSLPTLETLSVEWKNNGLFIPLSPEKGSAVFQRNHWTVVVLDILNPLDFSQIPSVMSAQEISLSGARSFKIQGIDGVVLRLQEGLWIYPGSATPDVNVHLGLQSLPEGPRLVLYLPSPKGVVKMNDPVSGEPIWIGLLGAENLSAGVSHPKQTPEFFLYPSKYGIVLRPLIEDVRLVRLEDGFFLGDHHQ